MLHSWGRLWIAAGACEESRTTRFQILRRSPKSPPLQRIIRRLLTSRLTRDSPLTRSSDSTINFLVSWLVTVFQVKRDRRHYPQHCPMASQFLRRTRLVLWLLSHFFYGPEGKISILRSMSAVILFSYIVCLTLQITAHLRFKTDQDRIPVLPRCLSCADSVARKTDHSSRWVNSVVLIRTVRLNDYFLTFGRNSNTVLYISYHSRSCWLTNGVV